MKSQLLAVDAANIAFNPDAFGVRLLHSIEARLIQPAARVLALLCALFLAGCIPRMVVVHDGIETKVIDQETKMPLSGAFAYSSFRDKSPAVLARSNDQGELALEPKRSLEFVIFMGEAMVFIPLWVCHEGYEPYKVGVRGGWNADFQPVHTYQLPAIELLKSSLPAAESCLKVDF